MHYWDYKYDKGIQVAAAEIQSTNWELPDRDDKLLLEPSWFLEDVKPDTGRCRLRRVNDLNRPTGLGASKVKLSLSELPSPAMSVHSIQICVIFMITVWSVLGLDPYQCLSRQYLPRADRQIRTQLYLHCRQYDNTAAVPGFWIGESLEIRFLSPKSRD